MGMRPFSTATPAANWKQNFGVLRSEIGRVQPIRDASVLPNGALRDNTGFIKAELNALENAGNRYDPATEYWMPPLEGTGGRAWRRAGSPATPEDFIVVKRRCTEMPPGNDSLGEERERFGFPDAVTNTFAFLSEFGYQLVHSEPTMVRYEGNGRYVQIFHGRRGYELGAEFGRTGDPNSIVSLRELFNSLLDRKRYRGYVALTKESVSTGVEHLAAETRQFDDVLRGDIPQERIDRYRRALTNYYSGKTKVSPERGHLP